MLYVPYRTITVMQITEYNLLSQSMNVYPLAPKDQYACIFLHMCDICVYMYASSIYRIYIHMYIYVCVYVCI